MSLLHQPRRIPQLLAVALLVVVSNLEGQILVGNLGAPANPFTNTPAASEWATRDTLLGASMTFSSPAELDAWAQTLDHTTITNTLSTTTINGTARLARHNTAQTYLVTQPAGVPAVILKATLRNTSGSTLYAVTVSYDYGVPITGPLENVPGQRVYFSLTGQNNSWQLIAELSGLITNTNASAVLFLDNWTHGSDLYLLWLDDNANTNPDGAYTIDNFAVSSVIPLDPKPIVITNSPPSLTVDERDSATFEVIAGGFPRNYFWFSNNVPVPGNNRATFTIPSAAYPANHNAEIRVMISNSLNVVTSEVAILRVTPDSTPPFVIQATGLIDLSTVLIEFSEVLHPEPIGPSAFVLYETGGDPNSGLPILNAVLSDGTNVVLTTEARTPGVNYSLRVLDISDASSGQNLIDPYPTDLPLIRQQLQLIGFNDNNVWNYSTETNLFGTGWEMPGYDDSGETWASGPAGLGMDPSANGVPIRTAIPYPQNSAPQFFRRRFQLPASPNGLVLLMRHLFEDAAVVFLNGQESGRYNVGSGPLSVTTRATTNQAEPTSISGRVALPSTNVHAGDNVIAVVVFQSGAASADVEMALELIADFPAYPQGPVITPGQSAGQITITWLGGTLMETSALLNGGSTWTEVAGHPTSPYTFTPTPGTQRFFAIGP